MQLSAQQDEALSRIRAWLGMSDQQTFRLFGYAGVGKTTLVREFANGLDGEVYFAAFTGKAAHVMQQAGCLGATTIHKLIYLPKSRSRQHLQELQGRLPETDPGSDDRIRLNKLIEAERENLKKPSFVLNPDSPVRSAKLLVIDECSMIDQRMGEDLESFGTKILVLGDPAQLPPVRGAGYFTTGKPDVMLTEIHRQARGNPIIELATAVRENGRLTLGAYGNSQVIDWADVEPEAVMRADQIIVGRNKTRRGANARVRSLLGHEGLPAPNDRLVCLRNNHSVGLLNGSIWTVLESLSDGSSEVLPLIIRSEDRELEVEAYRAPFLGMSSPPWGSEGIDEFDYGYALTCHKSQGSQWGSVFIFDESRAFGTNARQWLYTAITRAAEQVTVAI